MHFDKKALEFDKILEELTTFCQTNKGKELIKQIEPTDNPLLINRLLKETNHALKIVTNYLDAPFGGIRDITETLKKAKIYSVLRPNEFIDIIGLIDGTSTLVKYYDQSIENEIVDESLNPYFNNLVVPKHLKNNINMVISERGEVYSNASSELSRIRNQINIKERRITEKLNLILNRDKDSLSESFITFRNGRFTLPVKTSDKNKFKGTIIDYSSSGETVYMEPSVINDINNEISILKIDEEKEIERILRDLSLEVTENYEVLKLDFETISVLDTVFAKARYASKYECTMPIITDNEINLIKARHPLINQDEVVANMITFEKNEKAILITGPNTGGKTVTLKTMGLLSIMTQSGLLIPVREESKIMIFDNIFADIGDEQSIEQSLSTFSSHMTNIIKILNDITPNSLILLDELGSGTDPKEGASLAIAILDYLTKFDIKIIATTHYSELKAYAYKKENIVNASVEFNVDTLSPTYKLILGTPGKSNALLISERLGLFKEIIEDAKSNILTQASEVTDLINKLEIKGNQLEGKITEYELLIDSEKAIVKENQELTQKLREKESKLKEKIILEESSLIKETKFKAEELLKELQAKLDDDDLKAHEIAELKYKVKNLREQQTNIENNENIIYEVGDFVTVLKFNRPGELLEKTKGNKWIVKMGSLQSVYKESEFQFLKKKSTKKTKKAINTKIKKHVKTELDLRGMRYEEALIALDKYIDDCLIGNIPFATIIHGYGTLTIRKLVKEYLTSNKLVKSHRDGEGNEGGNGVTVAYF
ncbi:hypothetical protein CI105_07765 [Candidatus Izimaplasma bacterium ZiA1]|uniref:endonuclease MutS2 n=1 Tax=Candidatus Izimoplasma sp. ZiA1 TaxID=2024899 RepID=UPI000BAA8C3B|nr:hypothetical protein CI105_07765 [Candidatus Izimaplasma bacterium ZiA1]